MSSNKKMCDQNCTVLIFYYYDFEKSILNKKKLHFARAYPASKSVYWVSLKSENMMHYLSEPQGIVVVHKLPSCSQHHVVAQVFPYRF